MMKNKKADIPITILVIGVLGICALAILSFFLSDRSVKNDFVVLEAVEKASILKDKISFYRNLKFEDQTIKDILSIQEDSEGKLILEQDGITVRFTMPPAKKILVEN
jgi:flagellar basal body-associated protein FliL